MTSESFTESLTMEVRADTARFRTELADAQSLAESFGRSITRAFDGAARHGRDLSDVLEGLAQNLSRIALRAALKPLESGLSDALGSLFGNVSLTPFARGGVIDAPTAFPLGAGRLGLAGEAGPEAILPLVRGADGRLGVQTQAAAAAPVNVTVNVTTPDAESFRRSETQIGAMMSRVLARGQRNL